jgi:hypothetical protein
LHNGENRNYIHLLARRWKRPLITIQEHILPNTASPEGVFTVLFVAQKSNQNTWFSATLDFSLAFRWFSAFSPTHSVFKKTKLSCFGRFFPWFLKTKQLLGFLEVVLIKVEHSKENIQISVRYSFYKQTNITEHTKSAK